LRTLITGGNGQLGSEIIRLFREGQCCLGSIDEICSHSEVLCTYKSTLDITQLDDLKKVFADFRPHVVINAAAYTHVDHCESNSDLCFRVNSVGSKNLAIACEEIQAKLIHISTDYVFDGKGNLPYKEFDLPNPINIYGKSKYLSEEYIKQFCSRYFIIRTGWLYGYNGKNFVRTILRASKETKQLHVVDDQIGSPTNAEELAYHLLRLAITDDYGIYHCTGNGECSWYEFARAILEFAQIDCRLVPISSRDYNSKAQRPSYSTLDNWMLRCTIGDQMRIWQEALKDFIKKIN